MLNKFSNFYSRKKNPVFHLKYLLDASYCVIIVGEMSVLRQITSITYITVVNARKTWEMLVAHLQ